MKTASVLVTKTVTVNLPTTARDWQLYTSMKGCHEAAARLTAALKKAIKAPDHASACRIMGVAMAKDADFGAEDTEPRVVAESVLTQARGEVFSYHF